MSTQLIKHLENKAVEDSNTSILLAQWSFDEKLVSKSLENIAGYFPHFSSHNSSHSKQILINIERLLGKNLKLLSATDTWLILESAYWHDIGMLFDAKEAIAVTESDEFKEFVESLANDKSTDLNEFASNYSEKGWKIALSNYEHPQIGIEQYRQMIAEWFRRHHQANSQKIVRDPFNELGISSPRTELFPNRIYTYLGQICLAHGTSFQRVMTELPFRQTGLGTENCHPRFVACLLRLGDIFDIDDNRFCPVMAKQVYDTPSLSQAHFDKHKSIREFQLDNQTVSITAECNNESAYIETQLWFGWIKEELQDQMSQWKNIVPHRNFGLLPTVEKLTVEMTNTKKLINDKPMKFSIDEKNAIELLQGKNLYDDKTNIFRELIQNAVDATLLRAWIEHGEISETKTIQSHMHPFHETVQKTLSNYPIEVDLAKLSDCEDSQFSIWEFSVLDKGLGISLQDLQYMQQIAGSSRNIEKRRIIKTMPLWMRPSGEFGIGMHSAFLLMEGLPDIDKKIVLETKSKKDNKLYKIELTSPLTKQSGFCFIEELPDDMSKDYGTKLTVKVSLSKHRYHLSNFGFEVHDKFDRLKGSIADYVNAHYYIEKISNSIARQTPVLVKLHRRWSEFHNNDLENDFRIWDEKRNLYIKLETHSDGVALTDLQTDTYGLFRGQKVESMNVYFLPSSIDYYGFNAKEALQIDRNKWQRQFILKLIDEGYFRSLFKYIVDEKTDLIEDKFYDKKVISAYNRMLGFRSEKYKDNDSWRDLKFFNDKNTLFGRKVKDKNSFNKLISLEKVVIQFDKTHSIFNGKDKPKAKELLTTVNENNFFLRAFIQEWYALGGYHKVIEGHNKLKMKFNRSKNDEFDNTLLFYLEGLLHKSKRIFLAPEKLDSIDKLRPFKELICSSDIHKNYFGTDDKETTESLLIPFFSFKNNDLVVITLESLDMIIDAVWIEKKKQDKEVKKEYISKLYQDLAIILDETMQNSNDWKEARERSKEFSSFDSSILSKYDK
ncbi:HD domain-containing protein [Psychrobacter fulvigenes]|uniref:HD domain-containing protein n=1 Tax=Psychrobacter fulvigenes TaxID=533323 RepID=UPI00191A9F29|nr:hypothetical protein [Psychrobacter fulvigenes]